MKKSIINIVDRLKLAVKKIMFVSDRLSYIVLTGRWGNVVVLNTHAPMIRFITEKKNS